MRLYAVLSIICIDIKHPTTLHQDTNKICYSATKSMATFSSAVHLSKSKNPGWTPLVSSAPKLKKKRNFWQGGYEYEELEPILLVLPTRSLARDFYLCAGERC